MPLSPEQTEEISAQREQTAITRRVVSAGMEEKLYTAFQVLDHGFVRVVDYMGDDSAICQAARVSYGKGTKSVQNDEGLIRYLMRHWHSTPFEMCEIKLHVKLPVLLLDSGFDTEQQMLMSILHATLSWIGNSIYPVPSMLLRNLSLTTRVEVKS